MSEGDLEVLRDHYAATNERDFPRAMSHYADDVVLEIREELPYVYRGTYRGREAVGEFFGDWFRSFASDLLFKITELTELDDGSILVVADNHARGRASGVELTEKDWPLLVASLTAACEPLAIGIVRGGEGATKLITVRVTGAASTAR